METKSLIGLITDFIMELPKIIRMWQYLKSIFGNEWSKKLTEIQAGFQGLKEATNAQEREKAARTISHFFNS